MAQSKTAEEAPGIYLDLSTLPPTPARLVEILKLLGDCGYGRVALDWGSTFPWSLDARFRSSYAYPEEVIAALARQSAAAGPVLIPVAPGPDALDFVYRLAGYRHLFRLEKGEPRLDLSAAGGAKLYRDLVEDALELLAESREIAFAAPLPPGPGTEEWLGELAERGVRAYTLLRGADLRSFGERSPAAAAGATLPGEEGLFLCDGGRATAPLSGSSELPARSLLLTFQAPRGFPPLRRAIELSLDRVVERAPQRRAVSEPLAAFGRQAREAGDGLERLLAGAWEEIRVVREEVARATVSDAVGQAFLEARLERLRSTIAAAGRSSEELRSLLDGKIEAVPLSAVVASLVEPLEEELHLLVPRVQLLGRRAGLS